MTSQSYRKAAIDFIPISSLGEYLYCPRNCYLFYVLGEKAENAYTVEGSILHEKTQRRLREKRGGKIRLSKIFVFSLRLFISGFADVVELAKDKIYPVEIKRGKARGWKGDKVQLCAQGICLNEMTKERIEYGFLFYASSQEKRKVYFDESLRFETEKVVHKVRKLFNKDKIPKPLNNHKCRGCSLKPICLPKETTILENKKLQFK